MARRQVGLVGAAATVLVVLTLFSLSQGGYPIPLSHIVSGSLSPVEREALVVRGARVATALAVGSLLASSGAALQAVLRNPLASPFTLGVSQAAGFGAAAAIILLGARSPALAEPLASSPYLVPGAAFASSLAALTAVYLLASRRLLAPEAVVLAGVSVGFLFQALTMLVEYLAPSEVLVSAAVYWMFGDVSRTSLGEAAGLAAAGVVVPLVFTVLWMEYDALLLGDETATSLGVNVRRVRGLTLLVAALATALATAFTGVVGFVGLLAPHLARLVAGGEAGSNRVLQPLSALLGAELLLAADTAARLALGPASLPVGVTTALLGAPLLAAMLLQRGAGAWWGSRC